MIAIAKLGDRVQVDYVGPLPDRRGNERHGRRVYEFTVGSNEVIPGISRGVLGMAVGERKQLILEPDDAYGALRQDRIREISRRRLPANLEPCIGKRLTHLNAASGRRRNARIVQLKPETVVVDGNHPFAGKVLEVELQLVSLRSPSTDKAPHIDVGGQG